MALRHDIVGKVTGPWERSWTSTDSLLYAVAVGAGQQDPLTELAFSSENSHDTEQQAIPTWAIVLAQFDAPPNEALEGVDHTQLLHAEQSLTIAKPLEVEGKIGLRSEVTGLWDKGKGALVESTTTATDPNSGEELFHTTSSVFIRGEGGWGGERGENADSPIPERTADGTTSFRTAVNQALVYRLTGDRNPLHSDPAFAAAAGFERPILHGLGTYGITARLLINAVCDSDAAALTHISGRFTKPVIPGDELTVQFWRLDDREDQHAVAFRTVNEAGETVLDRGLLTYR